MGGERKARIKKEAKETSTKKSKLLCFIQDIQRAMGAFCKSNTSYILWWGCRHLSSFGWTFLTIKKVYQGFFFFSTVLLLRNSMFMQGKMYFLKGVFYQRNANVALLHSCRITSATLRRAEALCSPVICFLWEAGKNLNVLLNLLVKISMFLTL